MSEPAYDVALSFAGEDRPYVEEVAEGLRQRGVRVFYDRHETASLWGRDLYQHLSNVYGKQAHYTVVFVSKHYATKLWTKHELRSAQAHAFEDNRDSVLPVRFDSTLVPGLPATIGYIDAETVTPNELVDIICVKISQNDGTLRAATAAGIASVARTTESRPRRASAAVSAPTPSDASIPTSQIAPRARDEHKLRRELFWTLWLSSNLGLSLLVVWSWSAATLLLQAVADSVSISDLAGVPLIRGSMVLCFFLFQFGASVQSARGYYGGPVRPLSVALSVYSTAAVAMLWVGSPQTQAPSLILVSVGFAFWQTILWATSSLTAGEPLDLDDAWRPPLYGATVGFTLWIETSLIARSPDAISRTAVLWAPVTLLALLTALALSHRAKMRRSAILKFAFAWPCSYIFLHWTPWISDHWLLTLVSSVLCLTTSVLIAARSNTVRNWPTILLAVMSVSGLAGLVLSYTPVVGGALLHLSTNLVQVFGGNASMTSFLLVAGSFVGVVLAAALGAETLGRAADKSWRRYEAFGG